MVSCTTLRQCSQQDQSSTFNLVRLRLREIRLGDLVQGSGWSVLRPSLSPEWLAPLDVELGLGAASRANAAPR
eukprot:3201129-Amphidinium_carterae.1